MVDGGSGPSPSRRWHELGSGSRVRLESADLWMLEIPFRETIATAALEHRRRPLVMVRLNAGSDQPVDGWGECAALADPRYDPEDVYRSFDQLEQHLLPTLVGPAAGRYLPRPADLAGLRHAALEAPMAFAALEMAVADTHLRAEGGSWAGLLGVADQLVELGAVQGVASSEEALVDRVASLVEQGFSRVKLKVGPGWDFAPLEAVTAAVSGVRLQADANGSYSEEDEDRLAELDRFGLLCLEQPFDPTNLAAHTRLAARMRTPICLDEGIRSRRDIADALAVGACSVVCLKPARLGGLGEALAVVESCRTDGTPLWMGGMFESGYARGINTTLAALSGFSWPGDLSPAATYLAADLVPPPELVRTRPGRALSARLPTGPGMGTAPVPEVVGRLAVRHVRVTPR